MAGVFALSVVAEAGLQFAVERVDADARTQARAVPRIPEFAQPPRPPDRAEFADVTHLLGTARVDTHPARHRHPGPDVFELAVGREHLHAVIVAISDVDVAVAVGGDIVRKIELARFVARLPP